MDRPEDIEPNPVNGKVYCALTNNSNRGTTFPVDEANPLASSMVYDSATQGLVSATGNRNGYVLEISPRGGDHSATSFGWDLMLVCGHPDAPETYFAGYPKQLVSQISCPDNVAFDKVGNLWISTDGAVLGSHDGLFRVPVAGPHRGRVEQFLTIRSAPRPAARSSARTRGRCSPPYSTPVRPTGPPSRTSRAPGRTPTASRGRAVVVVHKG